jgi:hypothetical protein
MSPRTGLCGIYLSLLLAGCKIEGVTESDFPGEYVTQFPGATEMLVLRKDGGYTQVIYLSAGKDVVVHEGLWHYSADSVDLENPILPYSANPQDKRDLRTPYAGFWGLSPYKLLGRVHLEFDPDQGLEFRRL